MAVAELAYKVYYGKKDVDYIPRTPETLGLWFTYEDSSIETLACVDISSKTVQEFNPKNLINDADTKIKWTKSK